MKNELNIFKSLRLGAFSIALALAGTGFTQAKDVDPGQNCYCIVPAGSIGQILSSSGDVQVSGTHGFTPAAPGTALSQGSLVFVGVRSDAYIVFGGCHLNLLSLRDVSLDPVDGGICVRTTPIDGRTAGFGPAATSTLRTLGATFPADAVVPATGRTATVGTAGHTAAAASAAVADEDDDDLRIAVIFAGVAAVGTFVAIAVSGDSDPVSP